MSKLKVKWSNKGEQAVFAAAQKYLALLTSDARAKALVRTLRKTPPVEHAAKDLLRAAQLPLLPRDDPHVDEDLRRIEKENSSAARVAHSRRYGPEAAARRRR